VGLPKDVLQRRVRNELAMCERKLPHRLATSDPNVERFPFEVMVSLVKSPGPVWVAGRLSHRYNHRFVMIITEEYPYERPIVRWQTDIFHPNIMPADDGGYVCTRLLDDWSFSSNLLAFIKGIESLLVSPNPKSPYGTDSCTRAAEYFNKNPYNPPALVRRAPPGPRIVR
jgi:ubiquitin-protein ligase